MWQQLISIFLILMSITSFGQDIVVYQLEGKSSSGSSYQARKEIQRDVIRDLSDEQIKLLIGEEAFKEKQKEIRQKIYKNSNKYIPFTKAGPLEKKGQEYVQTLDVHFSLSSLREVLSTQGLLYNVESKMSILPVISLFDQRQAKSYKWWYTKFKPDLMFLKSQAKQFEKDLRQASWKLGFFTMKPVDSDLHWFLSREYRVESHKMSLLRSLAQKMEAQVLVEGRIFIGESDLNSESSKVNVQLKAYLVDSGKLIAEYKKTENTDSGDYQKLSSELASKMYKEASTNISQQILDAWESGKFGTKNIKLILLGRLSFNDIENIKRGVKNKAYQVKYMRERHLQNGRYSFELDISGDLEKLKEKLKSLEIENYSWDVQNMDENEIRVKISKEKDKKEL